MASKASKVYQRVALLGPMGAVAIIVTMLIWDYSSRYFFYQDHVHRDMTNLSEAIAFDVARGFVVHKVLSVSAAAANLEYVHVYNARGSKIASYPSTITDCPREIVQIPINYAGAVVGTIAGCQSRERVDFSYGVVISSLLIMLVYLALFFRTLRSSAYEDGIAFSIDKINHEIRKPLSIVKMMFESLATERRFEEFQKKRDSYLQLVQQSFSNAELILRNFSGINATWKTHLIDMSVRDLIEASLEEYHSSPKLKRLDVAISDDVTLRIDIHQMRLVISNVIKNAIEANCTELQVHAEVRSGLLRINIANNGDPIDRKEIKKIFKRYYTTKASGTGIGLEICRDILKKHGGQILPKEAAGWTTFEISLPFVDRGQSLNADKEIAKRQKIKVFIVDDEIAYQDYLVRLIDDRADVQRFQSGSGLLELISDAPPDIVFLDINLNHPHEDGLSLCRKLRQVSGGLCIVLHSHNSSSSVNLTEVGANSFVAKPMYRPVLDNILNGVTDTATEKEN